MNDIFAISLDFYFVVDFSMGNFASHNRIMLKLSLVSV